MVARSDFTLRPEDPNFKAASNIAERDYRCATFQVRDDNNHSIEVKYRFEYRHDDRLEAYHMAMKYEEVFERHGSGQFESVNRKGEISKERKEVAAKSKFVLNPP